MDPRGSVVGPSACLPDFGTASLERGASGARPDARTPRIGPCESHGAPAGPLDLRNARGRSADHKASRMLPPWPPDRAPAWRASLGWWARPRPRILDLRRRRCSGRCGGSFRTAKMRDRRSFSQLLRYCYWICSSEIGGQPGLPLPDDGFQTVDLLLDPFKPELWAAGSSTAGRWISDGGFALGSVQARGVGSRVFHCRTMDFGRRTLDPSKTAVESGSSSHCRTMDFRWWTVLFAR